MSHANLDMKRTCTTSKSSLGHTEVLRPRVRNLINHDRRGTDFRVSSHDVLPLLVTSASLLVTSALLVGTMFAISNKCHATRNKVPCY